MEPEGFTPARAKVPMGLIWGLGAAYKGFNSDGGSGWDFGDEGGLLDVAPGGLCWRWDLVVPSGPDVCSWGATSWGAMHRGVQGGCIRGSGGDASCRSMHWGGLGWCVRASGKLRDGARDNVLWDVGVLRWWVWGTALQGAG